MGLNYKTQPKAKKTFSLIIGVHVMKVSNSSLKKLGLVCAVVGGIIAAPSVMAQSVYTTSFITPKSVEGWAAPEDQSQTPWTHVTGGGKSFMCSPSNEVPSSTYENNVGAGNLLQRTMDVSGISPTSLTLSARGYVYFEEGEAQPSGASAHLGASMNSYDDMGEYNGGLVYVACDPTYCKAYLENSYSLQRVDVNLASPIDLTKNTLITAVFSPSADPMYTDVKIAVNGKVVGTKTFSSPGTVAGVFSSAATATLTYRGMYGVDTDGNGYIDSYAYGDTCVDSIGYQVQ